MLVVLKIPIAYVCLVVLWAIRAEPRPLEAAPLPISPPGEPWRPRGGRRPVVRPWRGGPHGAPVRTYARTRAPAHSQSRR